MYIKRAKLYMPVIFKERRLFKQESDTRSGTIGYISDIYDYEKYSRIVIKTKEETVWCDKIKVELSIQTIDDVKSLKFSLPTFIPVKPYNGWVNCKLLSPPDTKNLVFQIESTDGLVLDYYNGNENDISFNNDILIIDGKIVEYGSVCWKPSRKRLECETFFESGL